MFIAERQGFEPRVPRGTTVFKTAAIDHYYIFSLKTTYIPLFKPTLLINYYKKETMQNENPKIIMYICIYNRKNA